MIRSRLIIALLAGIAAAKPASATEQGQIGSTSKGEIMITASVASRAMLTDAGASADQRSEQSACLWLGTATRGYAVAAVDGRILWHPSAVSTATVTLSDGTTSALLTARATRPDCARDPAAHVAYDSDAGMPATLLIVPE